MRFPVMFFCYDVRYFLVEDGVGEGQEVLENLPGCGALLCDRVSCYGEPLGPDS